MRAMLACFFLSTAFGAVAGTPARADERPGTAITEIRQENSARATRLVVDCTGPVAYTYYSPDPLTLVVDIPEADASKIPSRINVATREVESLRVTSMARADGRNLARIEVRLASLVPYQIFSKGQSLNLVFDRADANVGNVKNEPPATAPVAVPAAAPSVPAPAPTVEAPPVVVPAPAPAVVAGAKATRILSVAHTEDGGQLAVTVRADGSLRYQDFFLGNPDRLVIDFPDVVSRAPVRAIDVNSGPVRKARLAQFSASSPKVARLVLDLSERAPYRILEGVDGVKVVFGEGAAPRPAPFAALRTDAEPEPQLAMPARPPAPVVEGPPTILPAPAALPPPLPAADMDPQSAAAQAAETAAGTAEKKYVGHPISLDFRDGDLQDIFRLFADISGMNVVVNPGVSGKITLKLNEVPWDQALDLILKANGLGFTLEGNVIRIARLGDLQREEQERRKLQDEKALAGDLGQFTARISYAKAQVLSEVLKKAGALSARGSINVDERTNTMLLKDLPAFLDRSKDLIAELDRPTPQVEIEARIVVTSRNFTRDLGIQWGFSQQLAPAFGNTTTRAFPHAIVVNGQDATSTGGVSADQGGLASAAGIGTAGRGYAVNLPAASFNSALGISMGNIVGNFNLDAALTALERQGRGRLLSTPKVTTQNNQEAEIKQGVQIPIQTTANNTVTVTFKDAVLTLKVTPQITDAGTVILKLEVENNSPDFANRVNGIPPINTQSAKTQVLVRDGATAVVGGIYQSNEQTVQDRTPFLGSVPVLGYLFRNRSVNSTNNELLLFITPRILKG